MLVGVVLTASDPTRSSAEVIAAILLVVYAAGRTLLPVRWPSSFAGVTSILVEAAFCLTCVDTTGYWNSPFVFTMVTPAVAAGFASGFGFALAVALGCSVCATAPSFSTEAAALQTTTEGTAELVLGALIAGYGRRIFGEAEQRTKTALTRLSDLTEANDLLQGLNALAQRLPASLDLGETVQETVEQVRALMHPDAIALFLWDASLNCWTVARAEGVRLPSSMADDVIPVPIRIAGMTRSPDEVARLVDLTMDGPGMTPSGLTGIYAALVARQSLVGVLAMESRSRSGLGQRDLALTSGIAEQAALAIDNAQWFSRLRTVGAEEERSRIARDLHDRVAQTLAYLAFELDRIVDLSAQKVVTAELEGLRHDVRRLVGEVRDTLYDLRTDVTESKSLVETLGAFLDRVGSRSDLAVTFHHSETHRLALPLERELWRIAQEAVTNVEHHARASTLGLTWRVTQRWATLEIADDGVGFPSGTAGRMDSYGLLGMRERADAIGATLEVDTAPGAGTTIRCRVEVQ